MAKTTKKQTETKQIRYIDAGSGQYVTPKYADNHPKTTIKQSVKVTTKKKK